MKYVKSGTMPGAGDYLCIKCNTVNRVYSDSQILLYVHAAAALIFKSCGLLGLTNKLSSRKHDRTS